jgi:hypothetical protein
MDKSDSGPSILVESFAAKHKYEYTEEEKNALRIRS